MRNGDELASEYCSSCHFPGAERVDDGEESVVGSRRCNRSKRESSKRSSVVPETVMAGGWRRSEG